jgi:predicted metalloendopeptidase
MPETPWLDFFNSLIKSSGSEKKMGNTDYVVIYREEFFHRLNMLFSRYGALTILDYMGWDLIRSFASLFPGILNKSTGINKLTTRERRYFCASKAMTLFHAPVSRLFVDKYFSDEAMDGADKIVRDLKQTFAEQLQHHEWLDDETKKFAIDKASKMKINTGYPKWLKNNNELDAMFPIVS